MDASKLFSIFFNRSRNLLSRTLIGSSIITCSRGYYKSRTRKPTLYSKISPLGDRSASVAPVLDDWIQKGNKLRFAELQRIIRDLRKRKRYAQALEVSEWVHSYGVFVFSATEHAVQLDLIGRVHGFLSAETYFDRLSDDAKTDKTYGALLNCYVRQNQVEKSLSHFQKMKAMGFASSPLTYNDLMCLYTNTCQHDKVPDLLREMKQSQVFPDNFSYRICINSYGARSDIKGMEKVLKEMETQPSIAMDWNTYAVAANFYIKAGLLKKAVDALKRSEERLRLDKVESIGYNQLISLHASLGGNKTEILRLWEVQKDALERCINQDYITVMKSLVRIGEVEEAEKILKEWESLSDQNCYDFRVPNTVISGYNEKGLYEKAETLLGGLMEKGKAVSPESWAAVASGYMNSGGNMEKAVEMMKVALSSSSSSSRFGKRLKPDPKIITAMLSWFGENGSVAEVEDFVDLLRSVRVVNREKYHTLMKVRVRKGKDVKGLLERMRADNIDEDDETKEILSGK